MNIRIILGALALMLFFITAQSIMADTTNNGSTTSTQTNTSGSNTSISGGYSQESTTTYQSGSSSNTTTSTTNTTNNASSRNPVSTSSAPSMSVYGQDSCVIPLTAGVTVIGFSGSYGSYHLDKECERRKKVALLNRLGMKVAAISLMCQDKNVWQAMMDAGTPCPIDGLIGKKAKARWEEINEEDLDTITNTSSRKFRHHR